MDCFPFLCLKFLTGCATSDLRMKLSHVRLQRFPLCADAFPFRLPLLL